MHQSYLDIFFLRIGVITRMKHFSYISEKNPMVTSEIKIWASNFTGRVLAACN